MDIDEARIWLKEVVKGELAYHKTIKAIEVILRSYNAILTNYNALEEDMDKQYNEGYQDGFKQAKFEVEMDKLQEEMTVSELKRIIKEYTESHDLYIVTDCSFFEIVEDAINIAKEIKEGNNEQV